MQLKRNVKSNPGSRTIELFSLQITLDSFGIILKDLFKLLANTI